MQGTKCVVRIVTEQSDRRKGSRKTAVILHFTVSPRKILPVAMERRHRQLRDAWHSVTEEIFTLEVTPGGARKRE